MNLQKKKKLIARTLGVGVEKISLDANSLNEIKEAITRQDIRDLKEQGIIRIKEKKGKKKKDKRKRRKAGSLKKKIKTRKRAYVRITRKLRDYVKMLKDKGKLSREEYYDLRKKIRARAFSDLKHLKEFLGGVK